MIKYEIDLTLDRKVNYLELCRDSYMADFTTSAMLTLLKMLKCKYKWFTTQLLHLLDLLYTWVSNSHCHVVM